MPDHQGEQDTQEPEGAVPTDSTPEVSTDDKAVQGLKSDLVKQRQRAAELEKQLQELKGQQSAESTGDKPPQAPESDKLLERLDQIERRDRLRELRSDMELSSEQAGVVADLMDQMPGLDAAEAKALAALRDPEKFSADGAHPDGFDPSVHGTSRPTTGAPPVQTEENDYESRLETIGKLRLHNKKQHSRLLNNLVGSIASKQMKRSGHQKIPLPRK